MIIWGIAFIDSRSEDWDFKSQLPRSGIRKKTVSDSFVVKEFWKDEKKSLAKINDGQRILRGFQQDIMKLNCLWRNVRVEKRLLWQERTRCLNIDRRSRKILPTSRASKRREAIAHSEHSVCPHFRFGQTISFENTVPGFPSIGIYCKYDF
jgi:hypothetical protein